MYSKYLQSYSIYYWDKIIGGGDKMNTFRCSKMVYSVKELAQLLSIGLNSAYKLTHQNNFPVIVIGRKRLIPKIAFQKWLESVGNKAIN